MEFREDYSGVLTAVPYAYRRSQSRLFRAYVALAVLVTLVVTVVIGVGLVRLVAQTSGGPGNTLTLSRALYLVLGVFVVLPTLAPVLFVARRHRRRDAVSARYERETAGTGLAFVLSVYLLLVATTPPDLQTGSGSLAVLYDVPVALAAALVLLAAALVYAVGRYR